MANCETKTCETSFWAFLCKRKFLISIFVFGMLTFLSWMDTKGYFWTGSSKVTLPVDLKVRIVDAKTHKPVPNAKVWIGSIYRMPIDLSAPKTSIGEDGIVHIKGTRNGTVTKTLLTAKTCPDPIGIIVSAPNYLGCGLAIPESDEIQDVRLQPKGQTAASSPN